MNKPIIAIKTHQRDYKGLINLGNAVYVGLVTNPYIITTVPPLSELRTRIDETVTCVAEWGMIGSHGSTMDLVNLRIATLKLSFTLKSLSQYVMTAAQQLADGNNEEMTSIIASTRFPLKKKKAPQGLIEQVRGLRFLVSPKVNFNQVMLKWEKPVNITAIGNVKFYKIYMSTTRDFDDAALIAAVTKTSFIYSNNSPAIQNLTFWIVPVNTAGDGVRSAAISTRLFNL